MKLNGTARYAMLQTTYNAVYAAMFGFASVYLLDMGLSNTQIGILIAISGVIGAIIQPVVTSYADLPTSPSLKKIFLPIVLSLILVSAIVLAVRNSNFILIAVTYACVLIGLHLLNPLLSSLGVESINQGQDVNFGVARGIGSLAYAATTYTLGMLVEQQGTVVVPIAVLLLFVIVAGVVRAFPFEKQKHSKNEKKTERSGNIFSFFLRYRKFTAALIGTMLIFTSHIMLDTYAFQIVESKGGGSSEMGIILAIAAAVELPVMFLFERMTRKVRCDIWFRISGIFFALKALGSLLVPTITALYAVQLFQMFGYALITVSSVFYISSIMQKQDSIKGQGYFSMAITLGSVIGTLIGGALIDSFGISIMIVCAVVAAVIGTILLFAGAEKVTKENAIN